jgi:hypothetical protein
MSLTPCIITHIPTKKVVSVEEALDLVWNDTGLRGKALDLIAGTEKTEAPKPTAEKKLGDAFAKWKASTGKQGIAFDPKSQAEADIEFLKAIAEYIKDKVSQGAYAFKQFVSDMKDNGVEGVDEFKDDWKDFFDSNVPPPTGEKTEKGEGPRMVEKTVVNRLNKGTKDERLQAELERLGLFRPVNSLEDPTIKGQKIYEELGNEGSLNALENKDIDIMTRLGIHRALSEGIQQQLDKNTDPDNAVILINQQARAQNLGSEIVSKGGLILRYWQDTLENSIVPYDYTSKLDYMKENFPEYYGKNKEQIEAEYKKAKEMMDKANADRQKLDNDIAEWEAKKAIADIQEGVAREKKNPVKKKFGETNTFIKRDQFEKDAAALKKMLSGKSGQLFSAGIPAELVRIAAFYVEGGARSFARFSKQMIEDFGDDVKPYLKKAHEAGLAEYKKATPNTDEVEIIDGEIIVPHSIIRQYVEEGVTDPKELVKKIQDELKEEYPDVTERQIRDAISRYGKQVNPSGDEIEKQIREMKSLMQKISQLEDIEKQIRPLKTGKQRDVLSDRQRKLTKEVREALKTLPMTAEDTARLLKTTLDSIKTRLRNEIADLDRQIETKQKDPKAKNDPRYDIEELVLKDQRDDRQRILDEVTANPEKDLQDKIDAAIKSIEESTKRYEEQVRRIKLGLPIEEGSTNPLIPDTPKLKAAKDAKERVQKELADLKKNLPETLSRKEQEKLDALQKELDKLMQGVVEDKESKTKKEDSPAVKALKDKIARQKELLGLVEAKRTPEQLAYDTAVASKERRLKELNEEIDKLAKGQETAKTRKEAKRSDVISGLDAKIEANKKTLKQMREDAGITERERLKAWKDRAKEKKEWYEKKLRKGDYTTKKQTPPPAFDKEAERIEYEKYLAKELYDNQVRKAEDAKRGFWKKFFDYAYDAGINVVRGINAGVDLGIILIQGLSLALKNPQHVPMALKRLALAGISEENFKKQTAKIKSDPLYMVMRKSKLSITEPHAHEGDVHKEESGFNSLIEEIWDGIFDLPRRIAPNKVTETISNVGSKANLLSALNRAQAAYMNTMRIEAFKVGAAMLEDRGFTLQNDPEAFKQYADAINTFSGRATIGGIEGSKGWYKALTATFYSPRNWASILKTTTPYALVHFGLKNAGRVKGDILSPAQKFAAETLLKQVALTTAYMLVIKMMAGWNNEDDDEKDKISVNINDPLNSSYMKMKVNGQTYDPWGGRQQQIVLQARIAAHLLDLDAEYTRKIKAGDVPNLWKLGERTVTGKFGPVPAVIYNYANSSPIEGEPELRMTPDYKIISMREVVGNAISPMTFPTIKEINERQPHGLREFLMLQGILGAGINTLDEEKLVTQAQQIAEDFSPGTADQKKARKRLLNYLEIGDMEKARKEVAKAGDTWAVAKAIMTDRSKSGIPNSNEYAILQVAQGKEKDATIYLADGTETTVKKFYKDRPEAMSNLLIKYKAQEARQRKQLRLLNQIKPKGDNTDYLNEYFSSKLND